MEEEAELGPVWPPTGRPVRYELFTVTQTGEDRVCLSSEDVLVVHNYVLESTNVRLSDP